MSATIDRLPSLLVVTVSLLAALSGRPQPVGAVLPPSTPVMGCDGHVGASDDDGEAADDSVQTGVENGAASIVGTVPAPSTQVGTDAASLERLALVDRAEAVQLALRAVDRTEHRRVTKVAPEVEQGFVVWTIKTHRRGLGPNPSLELSLDAGTGKILLVECGADKE